MPDNIMTENISSKEHLLIENKELQSQLTETEDVLNAIRNGEVDASVVNKTDGKKISSLTSAETPYRVFLEKMGEGAVTLTAAGIILYCNQRFSDFINEPICKIIGSFFQRFIYTSEKQAFNALLQTGLKKNATINVAFRMSGNNAVKTFRLILNPSPIEELGDVFIIITDISEFLHIEGELRKVQDTLESQIAKRTESLNIKWMN